MIDWAVDAFDPRKNPWFRDEFIHPLDFNKQSNVEPPTMIDSAFGRSERFR